MLFYFFVLFKFFSLLFVLFFLSSYSVVLVYDLLILGSLDLFSFYLFVDWYTLVFVSVLLVMVSGVNSFMDYYFEFEVNLVRFVYIFNLFVFSMILLVISPSFMSFFIGWDGLGFISFFLVSWYGCGSSLTSSLKTFLVKRLGDSLYMIGLVWYFSSFSFSLHSFDCLVVFVMLLAFFTKSAMYPFSYWLPEAMAAPTPVSALVHSSTLVMAGLYMVFRLFDSLSISFMFIFSLLSLITLLLGSLSSLFTLDSKKLVAYSTLSQLGFLGCLLSYGCLNLFFYYMIVHALFKASMFVVLGTVILFGGHNQDFRLLNSLGYSVPVVSFFLFLDVISLFGAPFVSSFFMKELVVSCSFFYSYSLVFSVLFIVSLFFTFFYSYRFLNIMFGDSSKYLVSFSNLDVTLSPFLIFYLLVLFLGPLFFNLDISDVNKVSSLWMLLTVFFFFFFLESVLDYIISSYNYLNVFYLLFSYLSLKLGSFYYLLDLGVFLFSFIGFIGKTDYSWLLKFLYKSILLNIGFYIFISLFMVFSVCYI